MREGVLAGIAVSFLYTLAVLYAMVTEDPAWVDGVVWFAWLLAAMVVASWFIQDDVILSTEGDGTVFVFRVAMLAIQVVAFFFIGATFTIIVRVLTELSAFRRMTVARKRSIL